MKASRPPPPLVVLGGSAGSLGGIREVVEALPRGFPAAVLVVLHLSSEWPSQLADVLGRKARIPVAVARDGTPLRTGRAWVGVPDQHLKVIDGILGLSRGPRENRHRPSIDALFRSAAAAAGPGVIGVLFSGMLDDGSAGLAAIKAAGGLTIVQNPHEAEFPDMPLNAIKNVEVDFCVPLQRIYGLLSRYASKLKPRSAETPEIGNLDPASRRALLEREGRPAAMTCPDCGGPLWQTSETDLLRFRCQTGHAYSPESLDRSFSEGIERALWSAVSALLDKAAFSRKLADRLSTGRLHEVANRYVHQAEDAAAKAAEIDRLIRSGILAGGSDKAAPGRRRTTPARLRALPAKRAARQRPGRKGGR